MRDRIGRNLIRLRNERGQSLLDLAALSQVSDGTLQEVELGRELPIVEVLRKLARALKVSCNASLEEPGKREARPCVDAARASGKYEANPGAYELFMSISTELSRSLMKVAFIFLRRSNPAFPCSRSVY